MAHQIRVDLGDLKALAAAVKELEWYTGGGGYILSGVSAEPDGTATWSLEVKRDEAMGQKREASAQEEGRHASQARRPGEPGRLVEPGDRVVVETKNQQMVRRSVGGQLQGVEGVVFRVLTRGPHPHGMKVELRDGTVGRVKQNQTSPGAGEPGGRR